MMSEDKIKQAVDELIATAQGTNDSDMPQSPNPFAGEIGPSPTLNNIPAGDPALAGDKPLADTGETPDPAVFDAGGIDAPDTDGMSRTHPGGD